MFVRDNDDCFSKAATNKNVCPPGAVLNPRWDCQVKADCKLPHQTVALGIDVRVTLRLHPGCQFCIVPPPRCRPGQSSKSHLYMSTTLTLVFHFPNAYMMVFAGGLFLYHSNTTHINNDFIEIIYMLLCLLDKVDDSRVNDQALRLFPR